MDVLLAAVAVNVAPADDAGEADVRRAAREQGVAREAKRVDRVLDQQPLLEEERLASDREADIERPAVAGVERREQLAEVPLEERGLDPRVPGVVPAGAGIVAEAVAAVDAVLAERSTIEAYAKLNALAVDGGYTAGKRLVDPS